MQKVDRRESRLKIWKVFKLTGTLTNDTAERLCIVFQLG